jgi:hypothetical protein
MADFSFDPSRYEIQKNLEKLPRGWYPAVILESEIIPTSKQDGFRLMLTYQVIDGPAKGRKITKGYNIDNPSAQAVEIAMKEIKTICVCIGHHAPMSRTEELYNRPLQIFVVDQKDSDYNDIKGYKDINGNDPDKITASPAVGAPAYAVPAAGQSFSGHAAAAPPAPAAEQISPDGQWRVVNGAWVPNTPTPPPPPPAAAAAPPPPPTGAPAWAQPPAAPAAAHPAPSYQPAPPAAAPAPPAWQPQAGPAPAAPAWAPQTR